MIKYYYEHYTHELLMRDQTTRHGAISLSFLFFLGGVALAILNFPTGHFDKIAMYALLIGVIGLYISGGLLVLSFIDRRYQLVPSLKVIDNAYKGSIKKYQETGKEAKDATMEAFNDTEEFLRQEYCEKASLNRQNNMRRTKFLYYGDSLLFFSSILIIGAGAQPTLNPIVTKLLGH